MGVCALACAPYAAIRFVEWRIDVHARGGIKFDDDVPTAPMIRSYLHLSPEAMS
jgi:hypothetical protein